MGNPPGSAQKDFRRPPGTLSEASGKKKFLEWTISKESLNQNPIINDLNYIYIYTYIYIYIIHIGYILMDIIVTHIRYQTVLKNYYSVTSIHYLLILIGFINMGCQYPPCSSYICWSKKTNCGKRHALARYHQQITRLHDLLVVLLFPPKNAPAHIFAFPGSLDTARFWPSKNFLPRVAEVKNKRARPTWRLRVVKLKPQRACALKLFSHKFCQRHLNPENMN